MKIKLILRTSGLLILAASLFVLTSCSKTADRDLTNEQKGQEDKNLEESSNLAPASIEIDEKDFTESDEDLTTVNYKEFYDQLTSRGEWIQVLPEEIGLQSKTALSKSSGNSSSSLSNLFVIEDAYAASDANVEMVYVWKPSTDLAVTWVEGETPVYVPYTNGQWVNTDAGWYFKAPTAEEELVHHFGRWVNSAADGWLWVPGRVWAPAWVEWKQNDTHLGWAPVPPSVYIVNNNINVPPIDEDRYVIVEKKYFVQPQIYKYMYMENKNKIMIKEMTKTDGVMIMNKTVINKGPDAADIEKHWGNRIETVKLNKVKVRNDVKYSDKEYHVYTPTFTKVKNSENVKTPVFQPKSFKKYDERGVRKAGDRETKKEQKELRKEDKGNNNGKKYDADDKDKKNDGNEKGSKNKGSDNGKGKK